MAKPRLLILDEPSRSLDPVASSHLESMLRQLADDGATVVLSSHRLDEVEAVCDRVLVLIEGQQRAWLSNDELSRGGAGSTAAALRQMLLDADADADADADEDTDTDVGDWPA